LNLLSDAAFERTGSYADYAATKVVLHNAGVLTKGGSTGVSTLGAMIEFANEGTLDIQSGTLAVECPLASSGGITVAEKAVMELTGSPVSLDQPAGSLGAGFIEIPSSTVTLSGTVEQLRLTGGALRGTFTLAGQNEWSGGVIENANITVLEGAEWEVSGDRDWQFEKTVLNNGGTIKRTGEGRLLAYLSGTSSDVLITNLPSGRIEIENDTAITRAGSYETYEATKVVLHNAGTLVRATGTNVTEVGKLVAFLNHGTVRVEAGGLEFPHGTGSWGEYEVAEGTEVVFTGGSVSLNEGHSASGEGFFGIPEGTVTLNGTATGMFHWTGGRLRNGTLMIPEGSVLEVDGEAAKRLQRYTLNNAGVLNWSGTGALLADLPGTSDDVTINNLAGGTLNLLSDASFVRTGSYADYVPTDVELHNAGLVTKRGSNGTSTIGAMIDLTNEGTLDVEQGILEVKGDFVSGPASLIRTGVGGAESGTDYGKLILSGSASLDGRFEPYAFAGLAPDAVEVVVSLEGTSLGGQFDQVGLVSMGHGYIGLPVLVDNRVTTFVTYGVTLHILPPEDGHFVLQVAGEPDTDYVLEVAEDIPFWSEVTPFNSPTGFFDWTDDVITDHPRRLFRVRKAGSEP
jgi:hypothetical protein